MRTHIFAIALLCGCSIPQPTSFKKLSYPMPVSHVVVDGVEVAFSDVGVGELALVFIYGFGSYMLVW